MPFTPSPFAIVTPEQVHAARSGGARLSLDDDGELARVGAVIDAVSSEVDAILGYRVIVQRIVDDMPVWRPGPNGRIVAGLAAYPLVQAVTAGLLPYGVRAASAADLPDGDAIDYYAGYRRADQSLEDLVAAIDAGLTILPPLVPAPIASLVIDTVLYRLNEASLGVGLSRTTVHMGSGDISKEAMASRWSDGRLGSWWDANVHRIDAYRRIL